MTTPQKSMLVALASGADVNLIAQFAAAADDKRTAQTILALLRRGMLGYAKGGGLEISAKGREQADRINSRKTPAKVTR